MGCDAAPSGDGLTAGPPGAKRRHRKLGEGMAELGASRSRSDDPDLGLRRRPRDVPRGAAELPDAIRWLAKGSRAVLRRIPGMPRLVAELRRLRRSVTHRLIAPRRSRRRAAIDLRRFLQSSARLALPCADAPEVSILLVLAGGAETALACLRSIIVAVDRPAEVVAIAAVRDDGVERLLGRLDGIRIWRSPPGESILAAVNDAALAARSDAILLLRSDLNMRSGTLRGACRTLLQQSDTGAVGGPVVQLDGRLREAGSIIFSDGSCVAYGRGGDPADGAFNFAREVDCFAGGFLLIRRAAFAALGGLDLGGVAAGCEFADFSMRLRAAGYRVAYDPDAVVDHFGAAGPAAASEGVSEPKRILASRHRAALLRSHHPPGTAPLVARMRDAARGRVLVIDDRVPYPALGAGYPRAARILNLLHHSGWFVTHYPLTFPAEHWTELRAAFSARIEVMIGAGPMALAAFLQARAGYYDLVLVSRPHNMRSFLHHGGRAFAARLIYDAEAVFADREIARLALAGTPLSETRGAALRAEEMRLALAADTVLAVSGREAALFRAAGCPDVRVLGHALAPLPTAPPHGERDDLLFVGALDEEQAPNVDGLLWFVEQVMPLLDRMIGANWRLIVAGRCSARLVQALAGPRVRMLGRVPDLTPLYASSRLFVAPMRYSGGIPHKVHEAAAYGLPVVTTALVAGHLGWRHEADLLAGDTADAFARCCARLYQDAALWGRLREGALTALARDCDETRFAAVVAALLDQGRAPKPVPHELLTAE